jgi:hypothetical protein
MGQWANGPMGQYGGASIPDRGRRRIYYLAPTRGWHGSDVLRREAEAKPKNESYSTVRVAPPDKQNEWLTFVPFLMLMT